MHGEYTKLVESTSEIKWDKVGGIIFADMKSPYGVETENGFDMRLKFDKFVHQGNKISFSLKDSTLAINKSDVAAVLYNSSDYILIFRMKNKTQVTITGK